jgi:predicted nucleotidyltransferase
MSSADDRMKSLLELIESARVLFEPDERIAAAWLEGSFARGTADPWSDIDLNLAVRDSDFESMVIERHNLLALLGHVVGYGESRMADGFLVYANLEDLRRLDLLLFRLSDVSGRPRPSVQMLFDKEGVATRFTTVEPALDLSGRVKSLVNNFYYGCFQPLRLWNRGEWGSLQLGYLSELFMTLAPAWLAVDDPPNAWRSLWHNERFLSDSRRSTADAFISRVNKAFDMNKPQLEALRLVQAEMFELIFSALRPACERWAVEYPHESEASVRAVYRRELRLRL